MAENLAELDLPHNMFLTVCITILQEAVDQLRILQNIHGWPENDENYCEYSYKTIEERFGTEEFQPKTDFTSDLHEDKLNTNLIWFQKNCVFIKSVISRLLEELKTSESYENFAETVENINRMKMDENVLIEETNYKYAEIENLQDAIHAEKMEYFTRINTSMADIGKIKDEIEDLKTEAEIKLNYIQSWNNSKIEMQDKKYSIINRERKDEIKITNLKINKEIRVHEEILTVYHEIHMDFENALATWKVRYDEDLKNIVNKIEILKGQRNQKVEAIARMEKMYRKREKIMNEYKQYKIKQEEIKLEEARKNKAATKIQAWWKGTMVRKGFGKFRKKKEKKGKKKSSDKKSVKIKN